MTIYKPYSETVYKQYKNRKRTIHKYIYIYILYTNHMNRIYTIDHICPYMTLYEPYMTILKP